MNNSDNKVKIIIGYIISLVGLIFYFTEKNAPKTDREHYAQAGTIFIFNAGLSVISTILGFIPFLGIIIWILNIIIFVLAIVAAVQSASGNFYKIPGIYDLSRKIFK